LKQVVQLYETMRDPWALGAALYNLGLFTSAMGQQDEAITSFSRLVQLGVDVGLSPDSEFGLIHRTGLVKALLRSGDVASATDLFASLHLPDSISGRARFDYHTKAGELAMAQEDWKTAVIHLSHVVEQLQKQPIIHFTYAALLHALAAHHLSDTTTALTSLDLAESLLDQGDCIHSKRLRHFTRYQITHDPIALTAAHTELQRQTSLFTDDSLRHDFLQNDQINQAILFAWKNA